MYAVNSLEKFACACTLVLTSVAVTSEPSTAALSSTSSNSSHQVADHQPGPTHERPVPVSPAFAAAFRSTAASGWYMDMKIATEHSEDCSSRVAIASSNVVALLPAVSNRIEATTSRPEDSVSDSKASIVSRKRSPGRRPKVRPAHSTLLSSTYTHCRRRL